MYITLINKYNMKKLKFTFKDYKWFIINIENLDYHNIDYTIETDYENSYYIIIK